MKDSRLSRHRHPLSHPPSRSLSLSLAVVLIATLYTSCTNPPPPPPPPPPPKVKNPLPELPSTNEGDEINPELDPSVLPTKTAPKTAS